MHVHIMDPSYLSNMFMVSTKTQNILLQLKVKPIIFISDPPPSHTISIGCCLMVIMSLNTTSLGDYVNPTDYGPDLTFKLTIIFFRKLMRP